MVRKVHKYANGGRIISRETDNPLPKPKSPYPPKKIEGKEPGGPHTPGAKKKRRKKTK